ncbi:MAG: Cell division protein SepF [Prochlorococcus marinus str. MIT 9215]|nr:MAG: Cell division protein SepF [Prochlorococcus marinus str. MIT 9215]
MSPQRIPTVSFISRLRSVVAGDDYLDSEYDELDYDTDDQMEVDQSTAQPGGGALAPLAESSPFDMGEGFSGSNVIGMPGISTTAAEVNLMEPRSFDEMPSAIQALRERKTVILNLTMMEPDQAQRAVDFVAGGTFAIDGHQERVGESIFLFAPSCVTVTNASQDEASAPTVVNKDSESAPAESTIAPTPAWGGVTAAGL